MTDDKVARWWIYSLLIVIATGMMAARVMRVRPADPKNPTPFLSANDRSRWATIRSLGDDGTYVIDDIIFSPRGGRIRGWHTIDLVRHRGADGREHYYSSKPTLLTTLLAGEYWLIKRLTGATLADQTFYVARLMLILTNILPLAAALVLLARLIDRFGGSDWSRMLAVAAASFATFLTTFAVTLNNHLTAALSLAAGLAVVIPIWSGQSRAWWRFAAGGLAFGFLAANELPALSMLVLVAAGLLWKEPLRTVAAFVPAALVVAAAALGTNIVAHGDWRTPYAHRGDGTLLGTIDDNLAVPLDAGKATPELILALSALEVQISDGADIESLRPGDRWKVTDRGYFVELALQRTPEGEPNGGIHVYQWDNWYDYPGSYWTPKNLAGVDRGEASPIRYAFNVLIGHHGLFSLTPLWLLSVVGCVMWLRQGEMFNARQAIAFATLLISAVVIAFYLSRPQIDRNYGGGTCCLRWLIWLTPLWLLTMLPAADWLGRSWWGRAIVVVLLAVSVFSAHYAADNPWSHPWIFDYWTSLGWIKY
jgi:hypothetical protein